MLASSTQAPRGLSIRRALLTISGIAGHLAIGKERAIVSLQHRIDNAGDLVIGILLRRIGAEHGVQRELPSALVCAEPHRATVISKSHRVRCVSASAALQRFLTCIERAEPTKRANTLAFVATHGLALRHF